MVLKNVTHPVFTLGCLIVGGGVCAGMVPYRSIGRREKGEIPICLRVKGLREAYRI